MKFSKAAYLCLAALAACVVLCARSMDWQWLSHSSGVGFERCNDIAVDSEGNTLVAGVGQGACQFGSFSHNSMGNYGLVAKADAQGNWLWLQWTGSSSNSLLLEAIKVDAEGNSYITGGFAGTLSFGSTSLTSEGSHDVFTAKLGPAGNWLWARKAGETETDTGYGLALDSFANVYVTGRSGTDAFVNIYTSAGALLAGFGYPCTESAAGMDIQIDAAGNAFVAGVFSGSITFGTTTLTTAGWDDIFIVKITSGGNVDWVRQAGGTGTDRVNSLGLDSNSTVFFTGYFTRTASFGPLDLTSAGGSDIFIAKLGTDGAWLGALRAGGTTSDYGNAISVEGTSTLYLAGSFSTTATFGATTLISVGDRDMYVAKLTVAGAWLWARGAGSTLRDRAFGLAIDSGGELRVGGSYGSDMTVGNQVIPDADPGAYNLEEVFLFKIGAVIPLIPQNLTLTMSGGDAILSWSPVTQTVYGQLVTPDEYNVYHSSTGTIDGPYTGLGRTSGTSYTHEYVGDSEPRSFYRVSAYKY
ncbi:MAG: SBBP repeat-containing protein [Candidatus Syntrophosphaera sp.]